MSHQYLVVVTTKYRVTVVSDTEVEGQREIEEDLEFHCHTGTQCDRDVDIYSED